MPKRCTLIRERCKRKNGKRNKNNKKSRIWTSKVVLEDSTCDVQIIFKKIFREDNRAPTQPDRTTHTHIQKRANVNKHHHMEIAHTWMQARQTFFFSSNICSVLLVLLLRRRVASTGLQVIHHHLHAKFASASGG